VSVDYARKCKEFESVIENEYKARQHTERVVRGCAVSAACALLAAALVVWYFSHG
jgi:hypothetical protein